MANTPRTYVRKQVYFPDRDVLDGAMRDAGELGQSWSVFVNRALEHVLAVRHPLDGWERYPEFEES